MKIGVVSDSHDDSRRLAAAVAQAREWGAQAILHCGDIIGPNTLNEALALGLPVHAVHGNNLGDLPRMMRAAHESEGALMYYGGDASLELGGRTLLVNPGTVAGLGAPATFVLGDLADLSFEVRRLES
jgi:predicted phosphodiesterase